MANLNGFDASQVEPNTPFEPIPAGKYLAVILASEMKATKDNAGQYLELKFQVVDGPYKNRTVFSRLCIAHPNDLTEKIAKGHLSAICRAVGVMTPRDSVELHNLPMVVTVKVKKREDNGEMTNEVTGYEPRAAATQAAATPAATKAPWKR